MDPQKKSKKVKSKITYLGLGVKPKSKVSITGADPTYFVLKTRLEMISLEELSENTFVEISETNETFIYSPTRNLWMLVTIN